MSNCLSYWMSYWVIRSLLLLIRCINREILVQFEDMVFFHLRLDGFGFKLGFLVVLRDAYHITDEVVVLIFTIVKVV